MKIDINWQNRSRHLSNKHRLTRTKLAHYSNDDDDGHLAVSCPTMTP